MSEWIESHAALREHPKLKRFARLLGIERPAAVGYLHYLWWWAMDYAPDGDLSRYEDADIADALDWAGDAGELMAALRSSGFLDDTKLHDWQDYGEKLYRRRQHNAAQMRAARARDKSADENTCTTRVEHVPNTSRPRGQTERTERTERTDRQRAGTPPDELVEFARTISGWKPSPNDAGTIAAGVERLGEAQARDVICKLKVEQASSGKYRDLRRTLAAWFKTEKLVDNFGAVPARSPDDYSYGETPADIPEEIRAAYRRQGYDC